MKKQSKQKLIYQAFLVASFIGLLCLSILASPSASPAKAQSGLPSGGYDGGAGWWCYELNSGTTGLYSIDSGTYNSGGNYVEGSGGNIQVTFRIPGYTFIVGGGSTDRKTAFEHKLDSTATVTHNETVYLGATSVWFGNSYTGLSSSYDWFRTEEGIADPPSFEDHRADHVVFAYDVSGANAYMRLLKICLDPTSLVSTGTPTPTPSPTATVPPVPTDSSGASVFSDCPLLGKNASTFSNLPGLWTLYSAYNPSGRTEGVQIDNGHADMYLSLSRVRQYKIDLVAHVTDNWHEGLFRVQLGSSAWTQFRLAAEPGHQNFTLPAANYMPDRLEAGAEIYTLSVIRNWAVDPTPDIESQGDQSVIIDYICVTDVTTDPNSNDPNSATGANGLSSLLDNIFGRANVGACPEENATGTGDLLADVSQSLSFMWNCALRSAMGGIDKLGMDSLQFLSFWRLWLSLTTNGVIDSTGGSALAIAQWFTSLLSNTETAMSNAVVGGLQSIGILSTDGSQTVWEGTIGSLGDMANSSIINLNDIWDLLGAAFNLIVTQVQTWFTQTIGTLTGLWNPINEAINHEPLPIPGIAVCDDGSETISEACLPIFLIDNTILGDSSILGNLLPLAKGAVGFGLLWWAATYIRGQLMSAGENETA